ncbi:MAG: MalY/PatB family protein [Dysgonamonadaceae bacterium]
MKYNFDEIIDRRNTHAVKLDVLKEQYGRDDLIPLWVADMDFLSPPAITKALQERVAHGVFGYTTANIEYYDSIISWLSRRHQWSVLKEMITFVPGVVKGLAFAIDEFTEKGDEVIIQTPVYHMFRFVIKGLQRTLVDNPLIYEDGNYKMDFDGLRKIAEQRTAKVLVLCNPHNPGGIVWTKEELEELAEICHDNNILVISDEIHCDLALNGFKHVPFSTVSEKAMQNNITLMAPSKTFNIAGIVSSFSVIENEAIRKRYLNYLSPRELNSGTIFAYTATQVAYTSCEDWLEELLVYVQGNIDFVADYMNNHIPQIKVLKPQSSFLVWLDCRALNLSSKALDALFVEKANLVLNNGAMFGENGSGFMRLNVGVSRKVLEKAMDNLKNAIKA